MQLGRSDKTFDNQSVCLIQATWSMWKKNNKHTEKTVDQRRKWKRKRQNM